MILPAASTLQRRGAGSLTAQTPLNRRLPLWSRFDRPGLCSATLWMERRDQCAGAPAFQERALLD
jgi:hypothetical protein